jgi:hypothetical protein
LFFFVSSVSIVCFLATGPGVAAILFLGVAGFLGVVAFLVLVLLIGVPAMVSLRLFKIMYPSTYMLGLLRSLEVTPVLPGSVGGTVKLPPSQA